MASDMTVLGTYYTPELEARVLTAFERFSQNGTLTKNDFIHAWNNCDLTSKGSKDEMEEVFDKLDVFKQGFIDRRKFQIGVKSQIIKSQSGINPYLAKKTSKPYRHPAHRYRLYITPQHAKWYCKGHELQGGCRSINLNGMIGSPVIDCYACRRTEFRFCAGCFQDTTRRFSDDKPMFDLEALRTQFDMDDKKFSDTLDMLEYIFNRFDGDNSGEIDHEEFKAAYQYLGADGSSKEFLKVFNDMDTDGSGTISFDEFRNFVYESEKQGKQEEQRNQEREEVRKMLARGRNWREMSITLGYSGEPDEG